MKLMVARVMTVLWRGVSSTMEEDKRKKTVVVPRRNPRPCFGGKFRRGRGGAAAASLVSCRLTDTLVHAQTKNPERLLNSGCV